MKNKFALSALLVFTLLLAACGSQAASGTETTVGTEPPADPYASGGGEPTAAASVEISDQPLQDGTVTVAKVNAAVDGWVVIHTEADGKPGPVIGYAPVPAGESTDVELTVDASQATARMFAMLHVDEGSRGTYEFPGADAPVKSGEAVVMQAFSQVVSAPSVSVSDQAIVDGTVVVASALLNAPGWVVIHTEADGKPGPVIGYAPLQDGESTDIKVTVDATQATPRLFAMLHIDAGTVGTYEFPGDDAPVKDGDMIVMAPFNIK